MTERLVGYVLVAACVLALTTGQLLFKIVSTRAASLWDIPHDALAISCLGVAILLYCCSTILWLVALQSLPLSQAYILMALGFVLVPLGAHFFLGEPWSTRLLIGSIVVVCGIWIAST